MPTALSVPGSLAPALPGDGRTGLPVAGRNGQGTHPSLLEDLVARSSPAEQALRARAEMFEAIIDNTTAVIYLKDTQGRYLFVNARFEQLFHVTKQGVLGQTDYDLFPRRMADAFRANDQQVAAEGRPLKRDELVLQDDGVHTYVSVKYPLFDRARRLYAVCGISTDITDRKRIEEERDRFFTVTPALLCVAGFDGFFKQLNPAWETTLGYRTAELLARPYLEFVHPDDRDATRAAAEKVHGGDTLITFENRYRARDGAYKWLLWTAAPLPDQQLIYAAARDITERKEAEAALQRTNAELARSQQALLAAMAELQQSHEDLQSTQLQLAQAEKMESIGLLAAGVAHEVKNPLQIILMGVQYLDSKLADQNDDIRSTLTDLHQAVTRADAIVRGLLEFSSVHQLTLQEEDLNEVVEQALKLVNYELTRSHITVHKALDGDLPPVQIDRLKFEQVLVNLFVNAVHAMSGGGSLRVQTRLAGSPESNGQCRESADQTLPLDVRPPTFDPAPAGDGAAVEILIEDNGRGIPGEKLPRIFEPFFTTKPVGLGTGLGLCVARNIISLHGGELNLTNRPEGGVRVAIRLNL